VIDNSMRLYEGKAPIADGETLDEAIARARRMAATGPARHWWERYAAKLEAERAKGGAW
jgi:hypothetical protein